MISDTTDKIYQRAAEVTGKTVHQLHSMAVQEFAAWIDLCLSSPSRMVRGSLWIENGVIRTWRETLETEGSARAI